MIVWSKKLYLATVPLTSTLTEFNLNFFASLEHTVWVLHFLEVLIVI
jgi:hypothetical protein